MTDTEKSGGRAQGAYEAGHAAMSKALDAAKRKATYAGELRRRAMRGRNPLILLGAAILIVGAGALTAHLLRRK